MKGGLTPWGEFQDLSRGILVRSCKISKSTAMPLVRRISLAFHNNSWAKRCTLLPCVPPTAARLLTWTFMIYHAAMKTPTFCSPAIYFPSFTSRFGRRSFPYSSLYRSLVLRHPTLLSLGMTGAKPLSFKSRPPQILYGASKTEQIPKWNCPWTEMEIGESRKRTLKV